MIQPLLAFGANVAGPLAVESLGLSGFEAQGFGLSGSGCKVHGSGFRVQGSGI